jgi:hypothetical protein
MLPILVDKTTMVKNHTTFTYLPCVILRIVIGLYIFSFADSKLITLILSAFAIIFFSYKYMILNTTWKNYLRTVLIYSVALSLSLYDYSKYHKLIGTLIIIDALFGLQSRFIFEQISMIKYN